MAKVRVYELAKELGLESKALLTKLQELGEFVKSASSTLEPPVVRRMRDLYPNATPVADSPSDAPVKKTAAKKSAKKTPSAKGEKKSESAPSADEISALLAELGPLVPPHLQDLAQSATKEAPPKATPPPPPAPPAPPAPSPNIPRPPQARPGNNPFTSSQGGARPAPPRPSRGGNNPFMPSDGGARPGGPRPSGAPIRPGQPGGARPGFGQRPGSVPSGRPFPPRDSGSPRGGGNYAGAPSRGGTGGFGEIGRAHV